MSVNEVVDRLRELVKELERMDRGEDHRIRIQLRNILEAPEAETDLIAPSPEPTGASALGTQVRRAKADALIAAAEDARSRGDIGKEGGVEASDFLLSRAKRILDDEMFEFPHSADTAPGADPRLAPAVNEFRRVMARLGSLTAIRQVYEAMIAAFAAADAVKEAK
jgi:hypothetical protein